MAIGREMPSNLDLACLGPHAVMGEGSLDDQAVVEGVQLKGF